MNEVKKSTAILKYEKESSDIIKCAENLFIKERSDLKISGEFLAKVKIARTGIKIERDDLQGSAWETYKKAKNLFDRIENPFIEAERIARAKESNLRVRLDNERQARERKAELERQEKERKAKEKLLKQAEKAQEKGDLEKAEILKEQESGYFQPVESMEPVDNTINLESGKTHGVADIKIVSLDVKHIVQGLAKGMIPIHYLKVVMKDGEPQSLSMTGFKQFMKSKFGNTDQSYYGIVVKKIIRPNVTAGV